MKRRWKQTAGFTLVELIVVIAILGILAGVAVPTYSGYVKKANLAADQTLLDSINMAFAAACIENQKDVKAPGFSPDLKIDDNTGVLNVDDSELGGMNDAFERYLGGDVKFKALKDAQIWFQNGMFMIRDETAVAAALQAGWGGSSFGQGEDGGKGVAQMLLGTMDTIDGYLAGGAPFSALFEGVPSSLVAALGFTDMSDGFENMGVMHFAEDAKNRTAQEVLDGATGLMNLLNCKDDQELLSYIDDETLINCYFSTLPNGEDTVFGATTWGNMSWAQKVQAAEEHLGLVYGDLTLSAKEVALLAGAAEELGYANSADVSGLGGMYALAAGFYNSEYGKDSATKPTGDNVASAYGQFGTVQNAMKDPKWAEYMENQALKDMEAYVSFMSCLSQGEFGEDTSFGTDGYQFIAAILGFD